MEKISTKKLDELLNNLEAGLVLVDANHEIRWMNQKVKEWFGPLKLGEKRKCYRVSEYNEYFCRICPTRRTINFGIPTRYDLTFQKDDAPCNFEIIGLPIHGVKGKISLVMEFILSKSKPEIYKKETKDVISQMEKMASIGNLASGIAHELNTPLATISIISQELNDILNKHAASNNFKKEINGYLSDIDVEISRCKSIIENVQNYSKKGLHQKKSVNITDVISKTVDLICNGKLPKGVVIKKDLGIFPQVNTDPERFRQVILNILKNAVQAVSLSKRKKEILISLKREDQSIVLTIKDTGTGIPRKDFKRLFEPFFTTKAPGKGTGLGLFVSYGIMKDLGGDVQIKSRKGTGTSVLLKLPLE